MEVVTSMLRTDRRLLKSLVKQPDLVQEQAASLLIQSVFRGRRATRDSDTAQEVVKDARAKGWCSETRYHKTKGYPYPVLEPRFDQSRLMTSGKAKKVSNCSVVDLAVGKEKAPTQQTSLF